MRHLARRTGPSGDLVLVATDDLDLRRSLGDVLATSGLRALETGYAVTIAVIDRIAPVLVLLDLDRSSGLDLDMLGRIRAIAGTTPVIVLSHRTAEADKIAALDIGADDYIVKPFGRDELLSRIRVALRNRTVRRVEGVVDVGPIRIDHVRYRVTVAGRVVHLTPIEFRLLSALAHDADRVVRREDLLYRVWGANATDGHHLRVHIAALRRKLEPRPAKPRLLVTVTGVGYRLCDGGRSHP